MKLYRRCLIVLFLVFSGNIYAQWGAGISINLREQEPKRGIGFTVSRNLPFQFPVVGFSVRFEADLFIQTVNRSRLRERDYALLLNSTFFFQSVEPYISFGGGYAHYSDDDFDTYSAVILGYGGVQFSFWEPVYPFLEVKAHKYLSTLERERSKVDDFIIIGALGIKFQF